MSHQSKLGDRIRTIANQLRQEDAVQIKATSRILGAAAQLAENHDRLIGEVVEMVEEDLDQAAALAQPRYTAQQLQQQFANFDDAKAHFGLKARGWNALADKLNKDPTSSSAVSPEAATQEVAVTQPLPPLSQVEAPDAVLQRLDGIEQQMQAMQGSLEQAIQLLEQLAQRDR